MRSPLLIETYASTDVSGIWSTILACFIGLVIIVVFLAIPISSLLDTQQDLDRRMREKKDIPIMDLYFLPGTSLSRGIVLDRNDSSGASLYALFVGRQFRMGSHNGSQGILLIANTNIIVNPQTGAPEKAKLPVLNTVLYEHYTRATIILSNGHLIETGPSWRTDCTNLFIERSN